MHLLPSVKVKPEERTKSSPGQASLLIRKLGRKLVDGHSATCWPCKKMFRSLFLVAHALTDHTRTWPEAGHSCTCCSNKNLISSWSLVTYALAIHTRTKYEACPWSLRHLLSIKKTLSKAGSYLFWHPRLWSEAVPWSLSHLLSTQELG